MNLRATTRFFRNCVFGAAIGLCTTVANATLIDIHGGIAGSLPGNNDVLGGGVGGFYGGNLWLSAPAQVTYTYIGKEAGWTNVFNAGSGSFVTGASGAGDTISVLQAVAGYLDFGFFTNAGSVSNGGNSHASTPAFFVHQLAGNSILIGLDDGGAGPDADFDDMVLRVDATSVPEPATLALLAAGLVCLGVVRRRSEPRIS